MAKKKKAVEKVVQPVAPPVAEARAECCVICGKEYTNRKMGEGNPHEGQPVCTTCLPKALAEEKAIKEAAIAERKAVEEAEALSNAEKTAQSRAEDKGFGKDEEEA